MAAKQSIPKHKHVAKRSCVVCRKVGSKRELIRLVYSSAVGIQIDLSGKAAGRGAYLCQNYQCWENASRSNILDVALRANLSEGDRQRVIDYRARLVPDVSSNHD